MAPRRTAGAFGRVSCGQHLDESSSVSKNLSSVFLSGRDFLSRRGFHGPEGARLGPDRVADAPLAAETRSLASRTILSGCSRFDRLRLPPGKSSRRQRCSLCHWLFCCCHERGCCLQRPSQTQPAITLQPTSGTDDAPTFHSVRTESLIRRSRLKRRSSSSSGRSTRYAAQAWRS
jgi:hypothetical protein